MLINHNKYAGLVTGGSIKTGKGIGKKENIHTKTLPVNGDSAGTKLCIRANLTIDPVLIGTPGTDSGIKDFAYSGSLKGGFVGEDTDFLKIKQQFPGPSGLDTGDISLPPAIDDKTEKELPSPPGTQIGDVKLPGKGIYEKMTLEDGWNISTGNDSWTMELDGKPVTLENHMPCEKETFSLDSIRNHDEPPLYNVADSGLFDHLKDVGFDVKKVDVPVVEHEWAHDMLLKTDFESKHIPTPFWSAFEHDVRQIREKVAKPDFFVLGEDFGKTEDFPGVPLVNPEGYEKSRGKGFGVDLNRAFFSDRNDSLDRDLIVKQGVITDCRLYNSHEEAMSALYDLSKNSSIPPYAVVKETDDGKWAVEFSSEKPSLKGQPGILPTYFGEPAIENKRSDGLSIYLPGDKHTDYSNLVFARDTTWEEALKSLGKQEDKDTPETEKRSFDDKSSGQISPSVKDIGEKITDYSNLVFARPSSWEEVLKSLGKQEDKDTPETEKRSFDDKSSGQISPSVKDIGEKIVEAIKNYHLEPEKTPLWKEIYDANAALPEDKRKSFKELSRELYNEGNFSKQLDELAVACKATTGDRFEAGMDFLLREQEEIAKEIKDSGIFTVPDTAEQVKADTEQSRTMKELKNATIETSETGEINRYTILPSEDSEAGDGWSIHDTDRKDISGGTIRCLTKDPTGSPGSMVYNSYEEAVSAFFDLSTKSSLPPYGVVKETDDKKWSLKFTSEKPVTESQSGLPTCFTSKTVEITSDSYFLLPSEDSEGGQTEQINEALKKIEPERKKTMDKFTSDLERKLLG